MPFRYRKNFKDGKDNQALESNQESIVDLEEQLTALNEQILAINIDKQSNQSNRMLE